MFSNSRGGKIGVLVGVGLASAALYFYNTQPPHKQHRQHTTHNEIASRKKKRVAVIGAGVSGIVTTKWLVEAGHEVKTFEQSNDIGGNWRYIEEGGGEYSSCYNNLTTITSSHSMSLEGYPIPKSYGIYPHHTKVFKYLKYYCEANQLWKNIFLNTKVTSVRPVEEGGYNISYSSSGIEHAELFDAVAVCNGHNAQPYWPKELETELKNYTGTILHSRYYRNASQFKGKNVLILGGGVSGKQIAFDISQKANLVAVSSRRPINVSEIYVGKPAWRSVARLLGNTVQINPSLTENAFSGKTVKFSNGSTLDIDAIVVCTGYKNEFPFLSSEFVSSLVRYPDNSSHPAHLLLYKQTFPIFSEHGRKSEYPSLAFIGMMDVFDSSMFSVADIQAKWFAMLLSEKTKLPSLSQMNTEMEVWEKSINFYYHPMTIFSPPLFREQILKLIEDNKT